MTAAVAAAFAATNSHYDRGNSSRVSTWSAESALQTLPDTDVWIKWGILQKRVVTTGVFWHARQLVLLESALAVAREDSMAIIEQIPLCEIDSIRIVDGPEKGEMVDESPQQRSTKARRDPANSKDTLFDCPSIRSPLHEGEKEIVYFEIKTIPDGYNFGRMYCFGDQNVSDITEWVSAIKDAVKKDKMRAKREFTPPWYEVVVHVAKTVNGNQWFQGLVAALIIANFAASMVGAQLLPEEGTRLFKQLEEFNLSLTIIFTIELMINLIAHNCNNSFFDDGWNLFDAVIVLISWISMPLEDVPGFTVLRLLRVFRVIRLFKRLRSLRVIINALTSSLLPVSNAFMVLAVVTAIYAVIGVHLFKDDADEYFGDFSTALYSMFQVVTGDGWSEAIARPLFDPEADPNGPRPRCKQRSVRVEGLQGWLLGSSSSRRRNMPGVQPGYPVKKAKTELSNLRPLVEA